MVNNVNKMSSLAMLVTLFSIASGVHFTPAYRAHSDNPYNAMNIYVTKATLDIGSGVADLVSGDEIGIFDGTVCVGSGVVSSTIATSNILSITASAHDTQWPAGTGFTASNSISIHYWDNSEEIETFGVTATYQQCSDDTDGVDGCGSFSESGSAYMQLNARSCAYSGNVTCWDGSCETNKSDCPTQGVPGCITTTACNYNSSATVDNGSCVSVEGVCDTCESGIIVDNDLDNDGTCNADETTGCMQPRACNYNASAEIEPNDSCLFPCATAGGCTTADDAYDCSGELSVEQFGANLPEEFSITNIYPNPFNPITTINYGMQKNTAVKILIYNIVGEEIASLVNTYQTAGHHSVIWNADMHSGGMYLVKMIAGRHVHTKKLMLIK